MQCVSAHSVYRWFLSNYGFLLFKRSFFSACMCALFGSDRQHAIKRVVLIRNGQVGIDGKLTYLGEQQAYAVADRIVALQYRITNLTTSAYSPAQATADFFELRLQSLIIDRQMNSFLNEGLVTDSERSFLSVYIVYSPLLGKQTNLTDLESIPQHFCPTI